MPATFVYSDPHFGHAGACRFLRDDGVTKMRPWDHVDAMDQALIERFNDRVRPRDKVYFLGDIAINRKSLTTLARLHGDKVLIKGNHDIFKLGDYTPYFRDIRAYHVLNGLILSHIPVHTESLARFGANIHGHLHYRRVMRRNEQGHEEIDPRYWCACVEHTDYAPVTLEYVQQAILDQGGTVGFRDQSVVAL